MTNENKQDTAKRGADRRGSSAEADMGIGVEPIEPIQEEQRRAKDDPGCAPEEEGSATRTDGNRELLDEHKTDESGAPVD